MEKNISKAKVLVCDDSMMVRNKMKKLLTAYGFTQIFEASDGAQAVEKFADIVPDVTFMDIVMPELSGVEALKLIKTNSPDAVVIMATRVKLGVLAINAGYMTAKQVDAVHKKQATVDKRIGDIAVDMGYLTEAQVEELLSSQKTGCLLLGQALVDMGCLTNEEFETVLNDYKKENRLTDKDFSSESNEKTENVISSFFAIEGEYKDYCSEYVNVLFKNLIRFVGDDFTPLQSAVTDSNDTAVIQEFCGDFNAVSAITADNKAAAVFASRFAEEEITDMDYANDAISEFLNLSNGLYNVNISETTGKEIGLNPPETATSSAVSGIKSKFTLTIPVEYTFGTVVFTLAVI